MIALSLIHHTFSIERHYPVPAAKVFAAWGDPESKRRWFGLNDGEHTLDFRVGGLEINRSVGDNGKLLEFESRYLNIVPESRIVYASTLSADGELATTSITTIELNSENNGTVLLLTESDVFLDGQEQPSWREQGTADWIGKLDTEFSSR